MTTTIIEDLCKLANEYDVFLISGIDNDDEEYDVIPPIIFAHFKNHGEAKVIKLIEEASKEVINNLIEIEWMDDSDENQRLQAKMDLLVIEQTCKNYREQLN